MPMEKGRYPADWKEIALRVKQAAGWRCAACGKKCREPGEKLGTPGRAGHQYTLTVHHIDHRPENCSRENLVALCAPCHLKADAAHHAETRKRKGRNGDGRKEEVAGGGAGGDGGREGGSAAKRQRPGPDGEGTREGLRTEERKDRNMYTIKITSDNPEMREEDLENGIQADGYVLLAFKDGKPYLENIYSLSTEQVSRFFNKETVGGSTLRQAAAISEGYRKAFRIMEEDKVSREMPHLKSDLLTAIIKDFK